MRKFFALFLSITLLVAIALPVAAQQPQTQTAPLYPVNAKYANGVAPGYWPTAGSGLTLNLSAGTADCAGTMVTYSGSTLTMTASSTNYVYLNAASSCVPASNTTGFVFPNIPIAVVTTSGSAITGISDERTIFREGTGTGTPVSLDGGSGLSSLAITGFMPQTCSDTSGSGTAQSCSTANTFTPQSGNCVVYMTTTANSGTALTVNVNSLGAKSVAVAGSSGWTTTLVASSSVPANKPIHICYDGTNWDASGTGFAASSGGGGGLAGVNAKTASYTAVSGDNGKSITFNCPGPCTLTMPTSVPASPWTIFVSNEGVAPVSVVPTSGASLLVAQGAALGTGSLNPGMGVSFWSDSTNYHVNQGGNLTGSNVIPVLVQSPSGTIGSSVNWNGCSAGPCNVAFAHDVTPGDAIVVEYFHADGGTLLISDAQGDSFGTPNYTLIGGNFDITQYVVCPAIGGPTTILNSGTYSMVAVYEIANVATSGCQDAFNSGTNTSTSSPQSTGSITTTQPYDFILATGATRGGSTSVTFTEANSLTKIINPLVFASTLNYASFYGLQPAAGSVSDTITYSGESSAVAIYAGILALKPATSSNAIIEGDIFVANGLGAPAPVHADALGKVWTSNGPGTMGSYQTPVAPGTNQKLNSGSNLVNLSTTGFMPQVCADTSGSGTAQNCSTATTFTPQAGNCVAYTTTTPNSGTGLTVNINSVGAKSVAVPGSLGFTTTLVASNSIPANIPIHLCFDGTIWYASGTGFAASGGGGGGSSDYLSYMSSITPSGCTVSGVVCTAGSATSTISFAGIPATNQNLSLSCRGSGTNAATNAVEQIDLTLNNDTTSGHYTGTMYTQAYSTTNQAAEINTTTSIAVGIMSTTGNGNFAGDFTTAIDGYANTSMNKVVHSSSRAYNTSVTNDIQSYPTTDAYWISTAAVSSIQLKLDSGHTFAVGTWCTLAGKN